MKKTAFLLSLLICGLLMRAQERNVVPGSIIAMLRSNASAQVLAEDLKTQQGVTTEFHVERCLSASMHLFLFHFDPSGIPAEVMLNAVKTHPAVRIAQFDHFIEERVTVPNDSIFPMMWDLDNTGTNGGGGAVADADIDAPEAWDITTGGLTADGDSIVVAVIDGGFKLDHIDLNFWKNYQEIPNNGIDDDNNGFIDDYDGWNSLTMTDNLPTAVHGTHVSGTVGAKGNNGIGVTGVNWNVKVMPVSYGSSSGSFESNVVAAYAYVRDQRRLYNNSGGNKGAFVVATNSSFGIDLAMPSAYPLWCAMYDSLGAVGILSAGATANSNFNVDVQGDIPSACPSDWLVTVTNTRSNDTKANAGYGATTIDLGAPGSNIYSTLYSGTNDTYGTLSGTSMATPHVSGTIALMFSVSCPEFITHYKANPSAMALVVKDSLLNATDPNASLDGITVTGGRLNTFKAVNSMLNYCSAVGIGENKNVPVQKLDVFPNPANSEVFLRFQSFGKGKVLLYNSLGEILREQEFIGNGQNMNMLSFSLNNVPPGLYFVQIQDLAGRSTSAKLMVK